MTVYVIIGTVAPGIEPTVEVIEYKYDPDYPEPDIIREFLATIRGMGNLERCAVYKGNELIGVIHGGVT